ncbi:hypothetical protein [Oscillatoria sp. HE19RPO]|uniref:hypothetical protein n=1 Tax=Oscillatoria sp. HE19RPO TaxID=2954806 RepID=UPI0020C2D687|nr:hypothetical protein [Oscillatoria sp. HE19RPO]
MNLSTSNSKPTVLIKRVFAHPLLSPLIICLLFLMAYQLLIWVNLIPPSSGISQRQENIIKGQRYLYQKNRPNSIVIIGSSITGGIKAQNIGYQVTNIAMAGSNSKTGLELIKLNSTLPSLLLIEINETISKEIDRQLIESVHHPILDSIRFYLPMFREEYKPISVLVDSLKQTAQSQGPIAEVSEPVTPIANPEFRERFIATMAETQQEKLSEQAIQDLQKESKLVQQQIATLQKNGVRVILFNLPTESRLENTPRRQQIQGLMRTFFPPEQFEWLPEPPSREWRTSDGIHLVPSDAQAYAEFLKTQLINLD